MIDLLKPGKPKCVHADFRVVGPDLDPTEVTKLIGLEPACIENKGDWQNIIDMPSEAGMWLLSTKHDSSINMDHHLRILIDLLTPKISVLQALSDKGHNLSISGYILTCHDNVESHISLKTLRALAQLPCRFWTDTYFDVDDEDTDEVVDQIDEGVTTSDHKAANSPITIPLNCEPVGVLVTLDISHDSLAPEQITQILALVPFRSFRKGEIVLPSRRLSTEGLWSVGSNHLKSESNINTHLLWLLDQLVGKEVILKQLQDQGYGIKLTCRFGIANWNISCLLDCNSISRLAHWQIPVSFDIFDEHYEESGQ